jgi:hypothetical protein
MRFFLRHVIFRKIKVARFQGAIYFQGVRSLDDDFADFTYSSGLSRAQERRWPNHA